MLKWCEKWTLEKQKIKGQVHVVAEKQQKTKKLVRESPKQK